MVKFIILHWTAGYYKPNSTDLNSYQLLIDGTGKRYNGKPVGQACSCGGMNSITYNISCCGGTNITPIKTAQFEAMFKATAEKCKEYGLSVDKVYTHAEIGEMTRNYMDYKKGISLEKIRKREVTQLITDLLPYNNFLPQNVGKVDLKENPYHLKPSEIRKKIKWYLEKM